MVRKLQKMCSYFKNMGCEQENKDKRKMDREGKESWRVPENPHAKMPYSKISLGSRSQEDLTSLLLLATKSLGAPSE